jgi:hypothetical protein
VRSGFYKKLIGVLLLLYCAGVVYSLLLRADALNWDFKVYYYAARAYAAGVNPYDILVRASVEDSATSRGLFMFVYPPAMLFAFSILSSLSYVTALHLFFIAKCALLIVLFYLWRRVFLKDEADLLFYFFCLAAFNSPIYIDLKTGNVSILEQVALWLAFCFFLKRRLLAFCVCIIAAAAFKGAPVLLLFLLLFLKGRKRYAYFFGALCAYGAAQAACYAVAPALFADFLHSASRVVYKVNQPSTFALLGDLLRLVEIKTAVAIPAYVQKLLFLGVVAAVVSRTWRSAVTLRSLDLAEKEKVMVYFACTAYVLVLPHFEDYSYIIMLVPAYYILKSSSTRAVYAFLFLFIVLSSATTTLPLMRAAVRIALVNSPLILTYFIWGLYVNRITSLSRTEMAGGNRLEVPR